VAARSVLDAHPANGESPSGAGGSIRFAFQPGKFLANAPENHQLKKILDENRTRPNLQDYPMAALAGERVRMLLKLGLTR
jgi:LDH2 family malate/lactate/ureidoglycolate dehydrogenase